MKSSVLGIAVWAASASLPSTALACGGFFCNRAQPVNQAAEGIIFADNGDGTVTAVIQIKYQGPSKNFSWLLPISSVPKQDSDIGVASDLAFQRLQSATNPSYSLTTTTEGTCRQTNFGAGGSAATGGVAFAPGAAVNDSNGVTVEASGVVGAFEWTVISLDKSTADPADVAVAWLKDNGYDVPSIGPDKLGPYLEAGMYLLALKLTKGADSGSIRPIVLTYTGTQASIPVKLTAVAANDDMGVLTWVLGKSRSVPQNYLSLELNEARINWFNAASNYNSVVIDAANDAGGQGFVTEFAGASSTLKNMIWSTSDDQSWTYFKGRVYQSFSDFFTSAYGQYGSWDGFWDATRSAVTLPDGVAFDDFKLCPTCYAAQLQFSPSAYLAALEKTVIEPVKLVQNLIDAHPELTRMYTTLSADEMTLDPLFTFNPDLPDVSNVHTAKRVIECNPDVDFSSAPWRIELPQGGVIRGLGSQGLGVWPDPLNQLPPNRSIVRTGASGTGKVVENNSDAINDLLTSYNADVDSGMVAVGGATGSAGSVGNAGSVGVVGSVGSAGRAAGDGSNDAPSASQSSGGCNVAHGPAPFGASAAAAALVAVVLRRRRRR
jgi:MYXO-CTERM domain-containing protein